MRHIVCIGFLFTSCVLFSQKQDPNVLMDDYKIIEYSAYSASSWTLFYQFDKNEHRPLNTNETLDEIKKYISTVPKNAISQGELKEYKLTKKYSNLIDTMFRSVSSFGTGNNPVYFFTGSPVRFSNHKDNKLSMIINSGAISEVYNTFKLSHRQRVSKIVTSNLLDVLVSYAETVNYNEIKYLGLSMAYGSKDFTDGSYLSILPEVVCLVCEIKKLKQYNKKAISEEELINLCDVYGGSRGAVVSMKKIKLTFE